MNDPIQQLRAEIQTLRAEFQQEIQSLRVENQTLRSTLSIIASSPSRTKPVLPTPTKFDGKPYRFKTWLPTIKAKITIDGGAIGDDTAQFYYVWDNLEPLVQAIVLPQLADAEEQGHWDYKDILQQLQRVYSNPNEIREAQQALHKIRQNDGESLPAYIARFERILHEAKGKDWPAAVKISTFRQGLTLSLQRALDSQLTLPDEYPQFLQSVQRLATRSTTYSHSQLPTQPKPDKMDLSAVDAIGINTIELAEVDSSPRARSVSPQQRDQWRKAGKCVRCGSLAHWVQNCHQLPAVKTRRPATAVSKVVQKSEPRLWQYSHDSDFNSDLSDGCSNGDSDDDLVSEITL